MYYVHKALATAKELKLAFTIHIAPSLSSTSFQGCLLVLLPSFLLTPVTEVTEGAAHTVETALGIEEATRLTAAEGMAGRSQAGQLLALRARRGPIADDTHRPPARDQHLIQAQHLPCRLLLHLLQAALSCSDAARRATRDGSRGLRLFARHVDEGVAHLHHLRRIGRQLLSTLM